MIFICQSCGRPNYFEQHSQTKQWSQWPAPSYGDPVQNLPKNVQQIYDEARRVMQVDGHTSSVMLCRTLLAHIAVEKGADANKSFQHYVGWLFDNHYVPPSGKDWVDHIRKQGNAANHDLVIMSRADAEELIDFCTQLLRNVYDFPARRRSNP